MLRMGQDALKRHVPIRRVVALLAGSLLLPGFSSLLLVPQDVAAGHHYPWAEPGIIQPGARDQAAGTLGFLFLSRDEVYDDGQPVLFATTVGHGGYYGEGEEATLWNGPAIGIVVGTIDEGVNDWTLIRVYDESRQYVDFSTRFWSGPTGMPVPGEIELDDVVCWYGQGQGFDNDDLTRARCARLATASDYRFGDGQDSIIRFWPFHGFTGDSGSPIFHYETGQALGMHLSHNPLTGVGTAVDVCSLIMRFEEHGYPVELATAGYDPPAARPTLPAPYAHPVIQDNWGSWSFDSACVAGG